MKPSRTGLGAIFNSRGNFLWYSMLSIAVPGFAIGLWLLPSFRESYALIVFLALIAVAGAYLWGEMMWAFFLRRNESDRRGRPH